MYLGAAQENSLTEKQTFTSSTTVEPQKTNISVKSTIAPNVTTALPLININTSTSATTILTSTTPATTILTSTTSASTTSAPTTTEKLSSVMPPVTSTNASTLITTTSQSQTTAIPPIPSSSKDRHFDGLSFFGI